VVVTNDGARILLVDDDPGIRRSVRRALEGKGYRVLALGDGSGVGAALEGFRPDVALLDLVLPGRDGIEICREIRASATTPVIVLSALGDELKKVQALDEGADDYLTKPFGMDELLARIRVALRRSAGVARGTALKAGSIAIDLDSHAVTVAAAGVHLTPKEYELLRLLVQEQGRVLTMRTILARVWGPEYVDDAHILRTFIHQLRTKLDAAAPGAGGAIVNDPGVGYRLATPES